MVRPMLGDMSDLGVGERRTWAWVSVADSARSRGYDSCCLRTGDMSDLRRSECRKFAVMEFWPRAVVADRNRTQRVVEQRPHVVAA
jgi:hypothetical protein